MDGQRQQSKKNLLNSNRNENLGSTTSFSNNCELNDGHAWTPIGNISYSINDSLNGLTVAKLFNNFKRENELETKKSIGQPICSEIKENKKNWQATVKNFVNMPKITKADVKEDTSPIKILSRGDILGAINCIWPELNFQTSDDDVRRPNLLPSNSFFSDDPLKLQQVFLNARKYREQQRQNSEIKPNITKHDKKNLQNKTEDFQSSIEEKPFTEPPPLDMSQIRLIGYKYGINHAYPYPYANQNRSSYSAVLKGDTQYQTYDKHSSFKNEIFEVNNIVQDVNYSQTSSTKPNVTTKPKTRTKYNQAEFEKFLEDNINKILDDEPLPKELCDINMKDSSDIQNNSDSMTISSIESSKKYGDISMLTNGNSNVNNITVTYINKLNKNMKEYNDILNKFDKNTNFFESGKKSTLHNNTRKHFPLFRNNSNECAKTYINAQLNPDYFLLYNLRKKNDPATISINIMKNNNAPLKTKIISSAELEMEEALQQYHDSDESLHPNNSIYFNGCKSDGRNGFKI